MTVWKVVDEGMNSEEVYERKRILGGCAGCGANGSGLCQHSVLPVGLSVSLMLTPVEMGLMSLFVYAGSAQFAMIALIAVQAPVAAIAMTVF